jgi:hypothetical protein
MRKWSLWAFAAVAVAATAVPARADTLSIVAVPGTPQSATGIQFFQTSSGLIGMTVTAKFAGGGSQTVTWTDPPGILPPGAYGNGWYLSMIPAVNTLNSVWALANFDNRPMTSLTLDAGTALSVFDQIDSPPLTFDSNIGRKFDQLNRTTAGGDGNNVDINVTYFDVVQLGGNAPLGDLYRQMRLDFPNGFTSVALDPTSNNRPLLFGQDTDPVQTLQAVPVPEPATLGLFAVGAVGLAGFALRRRKRSA